MAHLSDIEIAQQTQMQHIKEVASRINIDEDDLILYGKHKAKLPLDLIDDEKIKKNNLVLVTEQTVCFDIWFRHVTVSDPIPFSRDFARPCLHTCLPRHYPVHHHQ